MKHIFIYCCLISLVFANSIKIKANYFEADQKKGYSIFKGNVIFVKGDDKITTQKLKVLFKNKKPVKYETFGKTNIKIKLNNQTFIGSAKKIIFDVTNNLIILDKDVNIKQIDTNNTIIAEKIVVDNIKKTMKILGQENKPIEFTFDINEGNK